MTSRSLFASLILGAALAFAPAPRAAAADKAAAPATAKPQRSFANIDFLTVDFTQTIIRTIRPGKPKVFAGVAHFAKPGKFRWDFTAGGKTTQEYYFDGKTLSIYKRDENTVTHFATQSDQARELSNVVSMVLDAKSLESRYDVSVSDDGKDATTYTLKPKDPKSTEVGQIVLTLTKGDKPYVSLVKITYVDGNATQFEFRNPRFEPIPAKTFQFVNPGKVVEKRVG